MSKKYSCDVEGCGKETLTPLTIIIPPKKEIDLCEDHRDMLFKLLKGAKLQE